MDNRNPSASDAGPGSASVPFRTIGAAVARRAAPGNTIVVRPGTYPEQVVPGASGVEGHPFKLEASGPDVIVDGADDFSASSEWTPVSGDVWLARAVRWNPVQVFADGARLAASTSLPAELPPRSFLYVAGTGLYVNAGGGNPGGHGTRVGRRAHGFLVSGRSHVWIRGFTVTRHEGRGIYVIDGSSDCVISGNTVTFSSQHGIQVTGGTRMRIADNISSDHNDHGILLSGNVTASIVSGNESFRNVRPSERAANGIMVFGSPGNRVERNNLHDNQDSGLQINAGSHGTVCVRNLSWRNGDHGYDHLTSSGTVHIGEIAYGNAKDGFSIESSSPGARLHNCVSVNNGLATGGYDLWLDANSSEGFVSDYNVFWNANGQAPVRIGPTLFTTLTAYTAATGRDGYSIQADPRFMDPESGDFRLRPDSPAIDAATTEPAEWTVADFAGNLAFDFDGAVNTGAGPLPFADRGAYEFTDSPSGPSPSARLTVTPEVGANPVTVTADASASTDDRAIVSYRFDFGDGAALGPQRSPIATHRYGAGQWTLRVTVTNASGQQDMAERTVIVSAGSGRPPILNVPASAVANENAPLTLAISAFDPDGTSITSLAADFTELPSGNSARFTPGLENTTGTLSWTPTFAEAGVYAVRFRAASGDAGIATTLITVVNVDRPPAATAPHLVRGRLGREIVFEVRASDPDSDPISTITADLTPLPPGHSASFTPNATNTAATFRWLPRPGESGTFNIPFAAANGLSASVTTTIEVRRTTDSPAGDSQIDPIPSVLDLSLGYPNPAAREITFALDLPHDSPVLFEIFDLVGRHVWRTQRSLGAGRYVLSWDGTHGHGGRAAGVYIARVRAGGIAWTRRFVVL